MCLHIANHPRGKRRCVSMSYSQYHPTQNTEHADRGRLTSTSNATEIPHASLPFVLSFLCHIFSKLFSAHFFVCLSSPSVLHDPCQTLGPSVSLDKAPVKIELKTKTKCKVKLNRSLYTSIKEFRQRDRLLPLTPH